MAVGKVLWLSNYTTSVDRVLMLPNLESWRLVEQEIVKRQEGP